MSISLLTPREVLQDLIEGHELEPNQWILWQRVLESLTNEQATELYELLREDPESVGMMTQNLQAKMEALQSRDPAAWDKVVTDEVAMLNAM